MPVAGSSPGASSKKKETGTPSTLEICCRREAPTRLVPFSYFWICWKVMPSASPSFSWLIEIMLRRRRMREPTWMSMGLGVFFGSDMAPSRLVWTQSGRIGFGSTLGLGTRRHSCPVTVPDPNAGAPDPTRYPSGTSLFAHVTPRHRR